MHRVRGTIDHAIPPNGQAWLDIPRGKGVKEKVSDSHVFFYCVCANEQCLSTASQSRGSIDSCRLGNGRSAAFHVEACCHLAVVFILSHKNRCVSGRKEYGNVVIH